MENNELLWIAEEGPLMAAAIRAAHGTFDEFRRHVELDNFRKVPAFDMSLVKVMMMDNTGRKEHVFLKDPAISATTITGVLANRPRVFTQLTVGKPVTVRISLLVDWFLVSKGKGIGGFTIEVLKRQIPAEKLPEYTSKPPVSWYNHRTGPAIEEFRNIPLCRQCGRKELLSPYIDGICALCRHKGSRTNCPGCGVPLFRYPGAPPKCYACLHPKAAAPPQSPAQAAPRAQASQPAQTPPRTQAPQSAQAPAQPQAPPRTQAPTAAQAPPRAQKPAPAPSPPSQSTEPARRPAYSETRPVSWSSDLTGKIIRVLGWGLIIAFILPIIVPSRRGITFVFLSVEAIDGMSLSLIFQCYYPLLAGILVLSTAAWKRSWFKGTVLLATAIMPVLLLIFSREFHQLLDKTAETLPGNDLSASGLISLIELLALSVILAGAYTLRIRPRQWTGNYAAAIGGGLYFIFLFIPVFNRFVFLIPFKRIFTAADKSSVIMGTGAIYMLAAISIMIVISINCLKLLKLNDEARSQKLAKRIFSLWFFLLGLDAIYLIFKLMTSGNQGGSALFLIMLSLLMKIIPWFFGLFLLIPLGLAEFLLLPMSPRTEAFFQAVTRRKEAASGRISKSREAASQSIAGLKDLDANTIKSMMSRAAHSPRVRISAAVCVVIAVISVIYYLGLRDPLATKNLVEAARNGNLGRVKRLIRSKADIDGPEKASHGIPLHEAARRGHIEVVRELLRSGADIDRTDRYGNSVLHTAVLYKHKEIVILLIESGVPIDVKNNTGNTPLHDAVLYGTLEEVKILVENGADIQAVNKQGFTPITIPASANDSEDYKLKILKRKEYLKRGRSK